MSGASTMDGASTTGTVVTIGVAVSGASVLAGPGPTSAGHGHDWITTTAPTTATMAAATGNGHHRRTPRTGLMTGISAVASASTASNR